MAPPTRPVRRLAAWRVTLLLKVLRRGLDPLCGSFYSHEAANGEETVLLLIESSRGHGRGCWKGLAVSRGDKRRHVFFGSRFWTVCRKRSAVGRDGMIVRSHNPKACLPRSGAYVGCSATASSTCRMSGLMNNWWGNWRPSSSRVVAAFRPPAIAVVVIAREELRAACGNRTRRPAFAAPARRFLSYPLSTIPRTADAIGNWLESLRNPLVSSPRSTFTPCCCSASATNWESSCRTRWRCWAPATTPWSAPSFLPSFRVLP